METQYNVTLIGELADSTTDESSGTVFVTSPPSTMLIIENIESTSMQLSISFIADAV